MRGVGVGEGVAGEVGASFTYRLQHGGDIGDEDGVPPGGDLVVAAVELQRVPQMGEVRCAIDLAALVSLVGFIEVEGGFQFSKREGGYPFPTAQDAVEIDFDYYATEVEQQRFYWCSTGVIACYRLFQVSSAIFRLIPA